MHSINSLVKRLQQDFPTFTFAPGSEFSWSADSQTITYVDSTDSSGPQHLVNELAHAALGHKAYERDIQLIDMEREAWLYAEQLATRYEVTIDQDVREASLDSYRDWMHARSTCPTCQATGVETTKAYYTCPACRERWRVNQARICGLKRYVTKK